MNYTFKVSTAYYAGLIVVNTIIQMDFNTRTSSEVLNPKEFLKVKIILITEKQQGESNTC
jgi:hypothetical protein